MAKRKNPISRGAQQEDIEKALNKFVSLFLSSQPNRSMTSHSLAISISHCKCANNKH